MNDRAMYGLLIASLMMVPSTLRGQCPPSATSPGLGVTWDISLDEVAPYGNCQPFSYFHPRALKVAAVDVDNWSNGREEIIVGGNGVLDPTGNPYSVQVRFYRDACWGQASMPCKFQQLLFDDIVTGTGSSACYDFDIADVNDDTWPDIVVGRALDQLALIQGKRDTVFINSGIVPVDLCTERVFRDDKTMTVENPSIGGPDPTGTTHGVALGDIDLVADPVRPELVTCGPNYATRYFVQKTGDGDFEYKAEYVDGTRQGYRNVVLGDIDNDGDLDMVVSRVNGNMDQNDDDPNSVWFNDVLVFDAGGNPISNPDPTFSADDPFRISPQPELEWSDPAFISWVGNPASTCNPQDDHVYVTKQTFEVALADLDGDGDLDLLATRYAGKNVAFLNNGKGYFGSKNSQSGPTDWNDGCPAFVFPTVTADWVGESECVFRVIEDVFYQGAQSPFDAGCAYTDFVFTVPGAVINGCTGVATADMNGDRLPDVAFSHRNDFDEGCAAYPLPYLGVGNPAPPTYDFLFFNQSTPGNLDFSGCVELVGEADDGTAYAELVVMKTGDRRPEWLDANFENDRQGFQNGVIWGNTLVALVCDVEQAEAGSPLPLHVSVGPKLAGLTYQVLASSSGYQPSFSFAGVEIPLHSDALTNALIATASSYPGAMGILDVEGEAAIKLNWPPDEYLSGSSLWIAVVVFKGGEAAMVSNVTEVPLAQPQ